MVELIIIDDDVLQHRIIELQAAKAGLLQIGGFFEGKSAIDYLMQHRDDACRLPDVILLDINMPGMNGWDFLEATEPLFPLLGKDITIVVVSSSVDPQDKSRAFQFPQVKHFISKPVTSAFLRLLAG